MKRGDTYKGGWLKATAMLENGQENGALLTIKSIRSHTMDDGNCQRCLSFHEIPEELGLNATNWDSVAAITKSPDDDHWIGQKIVVYPKELDRPFNGNKYGLRVRAPKAAAASKGQPKPAPTEDLSIDDDKVPF